MGEIANTTEKLEILLYIEYTRKKGPYISKILIVNMCIQQNQFFLQYSVLSALLKMLSKHLVQTQLIDVLSMTPLHQ